MIRERCTTPDPLLGEGRCVELVRSLEWERTPLGPRSEWSRNLLATASLVLGCPHPMLLFWGAEHVQLYNDAFLPSLGPGRHPSVMGQRARECWPEAWPTLGRVLEAGGKGEHGWHEDQRIPILRGGRLEEAFWTYSFSPALDDDGSVGGVLLVCTETTPRVLADRRARVLRALLARLSDVTSTPELTTATLDVLRSAALDVPLAAMLRRGTDGHVRATGATIAHAGGVALDRVAEAVATLTRDDGERHVVVTLPALFVPGSPWPEPVTRALVARLPKRTRDGAGAQLVVLGLSPRRPLDAPYKEFLEQLVEIIAHAHARVAASEEAARARETLERCAAEREQLLDAAEAAARAKDEFLAMLGHELRNPLAPITTALHIMKMKAPEALAREREILERQASHLVKLVDDLLDVSRVARGKVTLQRTRVALDDVVARAVETAGPLFEQKRHVLRVHPSPEPLEVEADPLRLGQVFANLLTNAAKYTEPGGVIEVTTRREGDAAVVRVADNGVGIAPDQLPHVFDAFFQGPRSTDRAQGGLGLGLALVKSFVTLHGGSVTATGREGGGSVFEVRLPALAPSRAEAERAPLVAVAAPPRVIACCGGRVLLVDDSDDILEVVASLLRHAGYEVLAMHDAPSALRAAPTFRPEVAVLDIGLPAMDGYELASHLREALGAGVPKLIAMTGYGQEADRERARRAGFAAHLVKPVDPDELLATMRS